MVPPCRSRALSRTDGSSGAGSGGWAQSVTTPNRRPAIQSVRACDDLLVRAGDEVPPHDQRLVERLAADQEQPGRRRPPRRTAGCGRGRGRAASPAQLDRVARRTDLCRAVEHERRVLEARLERQPVRAGAGAARPRARRSGRVDPGRGAVAGELARPPR